ncbi:MAG: 6-carboxytetrahydropterin synthase QueD [bacterium]
MYEIYKETTFSSAHRLREYKGRCESLHGHNWRARVYVAAEELDKLGMVIDFKLLKSALEESAGKLDHVYINDTPPFDAINPSAENIARWLYDEMRERLNDGRVRVTRVMIWESEASCAIYKSSVDKD